MKVLELRGLAGVLSSKIGWFVAAPRLLLLLAPCTAHNHHIHTQTHTQVTSNLTVSLSPVRQWRSRRG